MDKSNQTQNFIVENSNSCNKPVSNSILFNSSDSGYSSIENSPQNENAYLSPSYQGRYTSQYRNSQIIEDQTRPFKEHVVNHISQAGILRKLTPVQSLANFVNSISSSELIKSTHNNPISSSRREKIEENKSQIIKPKYNVQPFAQVSRFHLGTLPCGQIEIPSSSQQSTIFTTSTGKEYITPHIIPTNEDNIENHNKYQFHQKISTNKFFNNKVNSHPEQEQFNYFYKPSANNNFDETPIIDPKIDLPVRILPEDISKSLNKLEQQYLIGNKLTREQKTKLRPALEKNRMIQEFKAVFDSDPSVYTNSIYAKPIFETNSEKENEKFLTSTITSNQVVTNTDNQIDSVFDSSIFSKLSPLYLEKNPIEDFNSSQYPYTHIEIKSKDKQFEPSTTANNQVVTNNWINSVPDLNTVSKPPPLYPGNNWRSSGRSDALLTQYVAVPNSPHTNISPTSNIVTEMKYETQSGPPTTPSHLTSSGVEPPHSSQASGIVMGDSPAEVVGVDSLLLSPWAANGPEFLEGGVPDVKQTSGFQDTSWVDSLMLSSTVNVASAQSLMEIKGPLPSFTNYTGHLSINGISGHHYHTIASSAQRSSVPSASPTPSSNQEYYESPVVSSSTPCPQVSQKHQPQNHQHQQQSQQHPHPQNQQLPQSTQQIEYDIDDIAEIIGSAIADTTVPGNGNGPSSEQTSDTSREWMDIDRIADWIMPECSPKTQETTSPNSFAPQIYVTTTPTMPTQQHAGSTLQNLLTQNYAPLLQARLQAGNTPGLQNASCGETPSSTSPYPPLSPPNRVSTSCSPDDLLHSSFATPSHPRKRSRSSPGSGQSASKKNPSVNTAVLSYGAESEVVGNGPKKPVHRCHMCNRAFLNKSNIKVHLRTHTGEKPFKCDVCSKAFRQKAHLIKHQQIHKRLPDFGCECQADNEAKLPTNFNKGQY